MDKIRGDEIKMRDLFFVQKIFATFSSMSLAKMRRRVAGPPRTQSISNVGLASPALIQLEAQMSFAARTVRSISPMTCRARI
jgi:hypothetical protein